jgi:uncharacterized protein (TIGR02145 family)
VKKITFLGLFIFAFVKLHSQDYLISFDGSGETTIVETVQIQNLTQGTTLTINGTDILHLVTEVGIEQLTTNSDKPLKFYPNPMTDNCSLEFEVKESGLVTIDLYDITSKKVISEQNNLLSGIQIFNVRGLDIGIYLINIKSSNLNISGKIISNNTSTETVNISLKSSVLKSGFSIDKSIVPMQYNEGERLLFKTISGNYSTITTFIPTESTTITSNFVSCTDADNNYYPTVQIGTQIWMAENLKTTKYIDNTVIPNIIENSTWATLTTPAYCWYENDYATYGTVYGALYNWFALDTESNDNKNICPIGFHIPTDIEWTTLTDYLGGESIAGGDMKETGFTHWMSPNTGATNGSGFSAFGTGKRNSFNGAFDEDNREIGAYWSNTQYDDINSWFRYLYGAGDNCNRLNNYKQFGMAVRCIKN